MTIRYQCGECGSVLNIKDEKAGTQGRCPKCKAEFLVPSAEAVAAVEAPADAPAGSASSSSEAAVAESKKAKSPGPAGSLSDDDIGQILNSDEGVPARDDYGVADDDDDDDYEDDEYEEDDNDDDQTSLDDDAAPLGVPPRGRRGSEDEDDDTDWDDDDRRSQVKENRKKSRRELTPPPQPAVSSSGIAQGLMGRAEKSVTVDPREEKKKTSRPFGAGGEHEKGRGDEEGFTFQEKLKYFGSYAIPIIIGVGLGFLFFTWYLGRMQRGTIPNLAPVTGTVTLDGVPLAGAEVHFHPLSSDPKKPNFKQSSSIGYTDSNGRFILTYIANVYGAVPGKHRVQVYASDDKGQQIVPAAYNALTTLTEDVKEKVDNDFTINLDSTVKEGGKGAGSFNPRGR